jgi:hypothetical protein
MVAIGARLRLVSTLGERMIEASGFYNDDGIDYLKKAARRTARRHSSAAYKRLAGVVSETAPARSV